jgi:hypothetical protein
MFLVSAVNSYFLLMALPSQFVVGVVLSPGGANHASSAAWLASYSRQAARMTADGVTFSLRARRRSRRPSSGGNRKANSCIALLRLLHLFLEFFMAITVVIFFSALLLFV